MKKHIQAAYALAYLLDNQFGIGKFRFGLSGIINLIPGIGDIIDALLSCYIVWIALQLQLPTKIIIQMLWNIFVNFIIGLLPIAGDLIYLIRKVNIKNATLLRKYASVQIIEGEII